MASSAISPAASGAAASAAAASPQHIGHIVVNGRRFKVEIIGTNILDRDMKSTLQKAHLIAEKILSYRDLNDTKKIEVTQNNSFVTDSSNQTKRLENSEVKIDTPNDWNNHSIQPNRTTQEEFDADTRADLIESIKTENRLNDLEDITILDVYNSIFKSCILSEHRTTEESSVRDSFSNTESTIMVISEVEHTDGGDLEEFLGSPLSRTSRHVSLALSESDTLRSITSPPSVVIEETHSDDDASDIEGSVADDGFSVCHENDGYVSLDSTQKGRNSSSTSSAGYEHLGSDVDSVVLNPVFIETRETDEFAVPGLSNPRIADGSVLTIGHVTTSAEDA